jgi:hypothetical protein
MTSEREVPSGLYVCGPSTGSMTRSHKTVCQVCGKPVWLSEEQSQLVTQSEGDIAVLCTVPAGLDRPGTMRMVPVFIVESERMTVSTCLLALIQSIPDGE